MPGWKGIWLIVGCLAALPAAAMAFRTAANFCRTAIFPRRAIMGLQAEKPLQAAEGSCLSLKGTEGGVRGGLSLTRAEREAVEDQLRASLSRVLSRAVSSDIAASLTKDGEGEFSIFEDEEEEDLTWTETLRTPLPHRPYTRTLATKLLDVAEGAEWPRAEAIPLLKEADEGGERGAWAGAVRAGLGEWDQRRRSAWPSFFAVNRYRDAPVQQMAAVLGDRGLLALLGMRKTAGSVLLPPPDIPTLVRSFGDKHTSGGKTTTLTVGARALAKHALRSSDGWWGCARGADEKKNTEALRKLLQILEECVWANAHLLPKGLQVYEVRTREGYGARWTADCKSFRGFLEPPMEDGHDRGWKH